MLSFTIPIRMSRPQDLLTVNYTCLSPADTNYYALDTVYILRPRYALCWWICHKSIPIQRYSYIYINWAHQLQELPNPDVQQTSFRVGKTFNSRFWRIIYPHTNIYISLALDVSILFRNHTLQLPLILWMKKAWRSSHPPSVRRKRYRLLRHISRYMVRSLDFAFYELMIGNDLHVG